MSPGLSAELGWGCKVWCTGLGGPAHALPGLPAGQRVGLDCSGQKLGVFICVLGLPQLQFLGLKGKHTKTLVFWQKCDKD